MSGPSWARKEGVFSGRRLSWRQAGSGPRVLFLHDAGGDSLASPALDDLAGDHCVLVVDLPGYGGSAVPTGMNRAADMASLLHAFLRGVHSQPAVVVGCSLGGWFAAELAALAPQTVAGLVLVDAAGLHAPHSYLFDLFAQGAAASATHHLVSGALLARVAVAERCHTAAPGPVAAALVAPWVQNLSAAAAMSWNAAVTNPALLGRLRGIGAATVVLWGEHDALIPLEHGRTFAAAIPDATLQVVRGAGHLVALERPDRVAAAVRSLTLASAGSV